MNANELDPPPQFHYTTGSDSQDYIAPLMACWFRADEIDQFEPVDRYITGTALIERWNDKPGLHAVAFIRAKIAESRLLDIHPIYGGTQGTFSEHSDFPPLTSGLFVLSHVEKIELEDFGVDDMPGKLPDRGTPVANTGALERGVSLKNTARKLTTKVMHDSWQKAYRVSTKKHPDKSDVWHAQQIAKLDIAQGRNAETIRKNMTR